MRGKALYVLSLLVLTMTAAAANERELVEMPAMMREHMLGNMRDHLAALEAITRQLADHEYADAAQVAETRLGMSSLETHGASHMAPFMPEPMQAIGTTMHRAASRFALAAREAELEGGLNKAFAALSEVMQQCVACHTTYRVH
jgi:cytochrome c556